MKKTVSDEKRFIAIATVILVVISIVALFPMILLVVASFTDENELITNGYTPAAEDIPTLPCSIKPR